MSLCLSSVLLQASSPPCARVATVQLRTVVARAHRCFHAHHSGRSEQRALFKSSSSPLPPRCTPHTTRRHARTRYTSRHALYGGCVDFVSQARVSSGARADGPARFARHPLLPRRHTLRRSGTAILLPHPPTNARTSDVRVRAVSLLVEQCDGRRLE